MINFSKGLLLLLSIGSTLALSIVAVGGHFLIPQFEELFIDFMDGIPISTLIILYTYKFWFILPVATLLLGIDTQRREIISTKYEEITSYMFIGSIVLAFLLSWFSIWSMYFAISEIASYVSK